MPLSEVLKAESIFPSLKASSKKQALQMLSERAAKLTGLTEREIFQTLIDREKLGSTGVGGGSAIPHGKLKQIDQIFGIFARLAKPIDFESLDDQPVDLIFLLLAPEDAGAEHLKTLARVARALRERDLVDRLRESGNPSTLLEILTGGSKPDAA